LPKNIVSRAPASQATSSRIAGRHHLGISGRLRRNQHFRRLAEEIGVTPAALAHRYALSLDIDTLVLGVKNRTELAECLAAADASPLPPELLARVDEAVPRDERT
jgi:aryl-alcohol dehydrogenase-like predicted oxidoreductase